MLSGLTYVFPGQIRDSDDFFFAKYYSVWGKPWEEYVKSPYHMIMIGRRALFFLIFHIETLLENRKSPLW